MKEDFTKMSTSTEKKSLYEKIKEEQAKHQKWHWEKEKRNEDKNEDLSCQGCHGKVKLMKGEPFSNFVELYKSYFNAGSFSKMAYTIFYEIVKLDLRKDEEKIGKNIKQLVKSFRYREEFEGEEDVIIEWFKKIMLASQKFIKSVGETVEVMKKHSGKKTAKTDRGSDEEESDKEESIKSFHGSIKSE